ncbi:hypothetical protein HRS9139_09660 [Pyrenophora teres f. teres]|uniref:Uncharacterized protein n=1 Tax=Pyrenophora teres f. teres TaxID=97479 RepID=A0A6S6WGP0_9PLEO|nr:hypothetical protein HRS9139_09660 [Pyrenophora teres f. teres]KAE8854423.1 hypothetical protein PTNB29_09779 [Pyrenophora teres f. teres]CAE7219815.1 hypothetical protein PTTW11_11223 [Pyrenophora teres f. teres]
MVHDSVAASRPNLPGQRPREEKLFLLPDADGKFQCSHCPKRYGHRCHEPYKFHLEAKHGYTIGYISIESMPLEAPKPEIRTCYDVWCEGGIHYARVNVLRSFGPNSTIQLDEDETFTKKRFFQTHFARTKVYEDTVRMITELDGRCCRPVRNTLTKNIPKYPSPNTATDSIQPGYRNVVKWLRSYFFACIPTWRRPNRRNFSARHHRPDLRRASLDSSKEAIIPDTKHRSNADIDAYRESSDLERDKKYRMSTANLSAPKYAASDDMRPLAQTTPKHVNRVTDASLPDNVTGVVAVDSFYSTCEGVYGHKVIVLTRSDSIIVLQRANFGALVECERIARQLRDIIGDLAYDQLSQFERKRIDVRDPVYRGLLPEEGLELKVGEALPLEQCSPILQAYVQSVVSI